MKESKYGLVSKKLKVSDIQEVDVDDQKCEMPYEEDILYSTWNCWAYMCETVAGPELAFGNINRFYGYKDIRDADNDDMFLSLSTPGFKCKAKTMSPKGEVEGHISTHEEIFMIRRLFTYQNYKPTVHFFYSPCDYAIKSIAQFDKEPAKKFHLITKKEIVSGGESVGIIIQGKRFKTRYYGNQLNTIDLNESATILQVSASSYAAFKYMLNHQEEGIVFPEDVDENEVLDTAKKYLKSYVTLKCKKIKMNLGK